MTQVEFNELQMIWFATKSQDILGEMYLGLCEIAEAVVKSYYKKKGLYFESDVIKEKASDIATFVIERYIKGTTNGMIRDICGFMEGYKKKVLWADHYNHWDEMLSL